MVSDIVTVYIDINRLQLIPTPLDVEIELVDKLLADLPKPRVPTVDYHKRVADWAWDAIEQVKKINPTAHSIEMFTHIYTTYVNMPPIEVINVTIKDTE